MAAEDGGERTEQPSERRLRDAAEEGRIARSPELPIAASLLGASLILGAMTPALGAAMAETMSATFTSAGALLTADAATEVVRTVATRVGVVLLGMVAALTGATVAVQALQARGTFAVKALGLKWDRMNPAKNLGRLFSMQSVVDLLKSLMKLGLVGIAVHRALRHALPDTAALAQSSVLGLAGFLRVYVSRLLLTAGLSYLALAALDYLWQWWQFQKSMRMTKDEAKREAKESDGDPMIAARRKQIARDIAYSTMLKEVPQASVVITNPTHLSIALRYDPDLAPVPIVVARGRDHTAIVIRQIARDAGVPLVENKPVARALYASTRVGTMIPYDLYLAVAEIIGYVLRTREARGGWTGSARVD